jgi:UDP-N-acetylglucosamine 3-dehydrogenase
MQYAIDAVTTVEMAAAYDVDEGEVARTAEQFGCATPSSYESLLRRDDLDAVVLVTPNHLHRQQAEAAYEAGLHVLVEKPIANTVADGQAMIEASERADRVLMVGHNMRRSREAQRTQAILEAGDLGDIVSMEIHFSADSARRLSPGAWRLRADQCPLLPIMQLGIHAIDLCHYFFGPIHEVFATTRSLTTPPPVVDSVAAMLQLEGGVHATMISNYCSPVRFSYRITGTDATLESHAHQLRIQAREDTDLHGGGTGTVEDYAAHGRESYVKQMEAFAQAVLAGTRPTPDGWAALQALAVVEALQDAAERQSPQRVERVQPPLDSARGGPTSSVDSSSSGLS